MFTLLYEIRELREAQARLRKAQGTGKGSVSIRKWPTSLIKKCERSVSRVDFRTQIHMTLIFDG